MLGEAVKQHGIGLFASFLKPIPIPLCASMVLARLHRCAYIAMYVNNVLSSAESRSLIRIAFISS